MTINALEKAKTPMIIVAAPSGAGKSSFIERICREEPRLFDTITYTTRAMRAGESQGRPYFFIDKQEFQEKVEAEFFVEYALVHNNLYGTSKVQIEEAWSNGKVVIMDVDVQGVDTFKAKYPKAKVIFIVPPSIEELRRRIAIRDGGLPKDIEIRMGNAQKEMLRAQDADFKVVNDQFEESYREFKKIVENLLG